MAKHKIRLSASTYRKLYLKLKRLEDSDVNTTIGGLGVSKFLLANASVDDAKDTPEIRTKRIVLHIAGNFSTNPATLKNSIKLVKNLLYGDDEYSLLQMRLNVLVKEFKSSASVSDDEAGECSTVGDCVDLVDGKIS